jgi:hypothetical protein
MVTNDKIYLGTELKLNINIEPIGGLSMADYRWEIDVYCNPNNKVTITSEDAINRINAYMVDRDNYILKVDTEKIGVGMVKCKVVAELPDENFSDNYRTEVNVISTGIEIVKA